MPQLLSSHRVDGGTGRRIQVLFYDDDSIRFRIYNGGPMAITEAFLPGLGKHVIIKVMPVPSAPAEVEAPQGG